PRSCFHGQLLEGPSGRSSWHIVAVHPQEGYLPCHATKACSCLPPFPRLAESPSTPWIVLPASPGGPARSAKSTDRLRASSGCHVRRQKSGVFQDGRMAE